MGVELRLACGVRLLVLFRDLHSRLSGSPVDQRNRHYHDGCKRSYYFVEERRVDPQYQSGGVLDVGELNVDPDRTVEGEGEVYEVDGGIASYGDG